MGHSDSDYLGDIFEKQFRDLYFYGMKLVPISELVKDTIQDLFTELCDQKQRPREIQNIEAYLFVSLRRELLRRVEKLRKNNSIEETPIESFVFSEEDFLVDKESGAAVSQQLIKCLDELTDRQREVILLRFKHEMEFSEIGKVLEMNVQSVRNLLFRALEKIRKKITLFRDGEVHDLEVFLFAIFRKR
ncbi:RNA polymerase sigma factor, sigma-70 family [Sunxiuqinia elliptica]|uniref:RNA polymerase sigma factor, sigma-70 family n=2 Tax=Sunxiuqinia elliptica TaxID=655355 RepID=A0A1I2GRB1_9BACT|nr:RNA polymerase sigma factor, sigma-70 family [Sunxiuqinia elliptica]